MEGRSESDLAERIICLIQSQDLRERMGKAALKRTKDFEVSMIVKQWVNLFQTELQK